MSFEWDCMKILIPKSKNDQVREGHIVFISRAQNEFCTVRWVEQYLQDTGLAEQQDSFLMCRLAPVCEELSPGSYGLHSLRSGGASTAINNGVSERLVGKHGRWKSGYSRDRYLKDDKKSRLSVTRAMKL